MAHASSAIAVRAESGLGIAVLATVLCSLVISIGGGLLRHFMDSKCSGDLVIAQGLSKLGVDTGDQVATVRNTLDAYYACPAGVRIVAQIVKADEFWSLSVENLEKVRERFADIGVKALITKDGPRGSDYGDWQEIPGTHLSRFSVLMLRPPCVPAFPGAQGGGALSAGGRGGVVYEVSNLSDSGSGSLRACVQASGPRTCVFRTGGTIALASTLIITNPYITIAGQTAPGGGIQITATGISAAPTHIFQINTHDVIIRYLRLRHGYNPVDTSGSGDGSAVLVGNYGDGYNIIVDHCSLQWSHGESYNTWSNDTAGKHNQTLSWSIAGEVLQGHAVPILVGAASLAGAASMTDIDLHHNLIATDTHRFPLFKPANGRLVNNLIYNWSYYASLSGGGAVVDYINNIYKAGPLNAASGTASSWEITAYSALTCTTCGPSGTPSIYMTGNLGPNDPTGAKNAANMFRQDSYEGPGTITAAPSSWVRSTPQGAGTGIAITADSTTNLATNILNAVGAYQKLNDATCDGSFVSNRDSVDARMVGEYQAGIGSIPKTQKDKRGFPLLAAGVACADSDHDGIPDVYEIAHGLNPNAASDGAAVAANGYTNLEIYLNGSSSTLPSLAHHPRFSASRATGTGGAEIKSSSRVVFHLQIYRIWESLSELGSQILRLVDRY
jgi:hypothetical protein